MNPIVFALRHPVTVMVGIVALVAGSLFAVGRMSVDIFPNLDQPVIYVAQPYGGMDPAQMEGLITNYYEYHFLYITGIHHVESRNVQGVALMKLHFHPGTDMAQAMAETINYVNRSRAFMPPGTVPPFIMRFDTGSVPVGYLVLSTKNPARTIGEMQRMALFDVRPIFASLSGVSAPPPFGGSQRTIVLKVDARKLEAQQISLQDVVACLNRGNTISPSGNALIQDQMPIVRLNAVATHPKELGDLPIRPGSTVCLRDIGEIRDTTDIPTGYALVDGRRTVYMLVTKRADASTLAVVEAVKANLERMRKALPEDVEIGFVLDQSPYVTRAMTGVATEAALGALPTGLMVLLFLRDWRSVLVVVLNIPLALMGAIFALWLGGQTINLMTLGGLALAVGILVDEATVEVENIHAQMARTRSMARAVRLGNAETAVPRLLAMLCVFAVFVSSFFLQGAIRALFVPLALAVGFAMVTSYLLSSTFVPVMSVWLLRHSHVRADPDEPGWWQRGYVKLLSVFVRLRWLLVPAYLVVAGLVIWQGQARLGREMSVPELEADLRQKEAHVERAEAEVRLAQETVVAADADYRRMKSQFARLTKVGQSGSLDQENVAETKYGSEAAKSRSDMALAQVKVREAQVAVAKAERDQAKALGGYARIVAPFDGVVTQRFVDPGHFVHPAAQGSARGEPLFVVAQIDPVRMFVDVPETDAAAIANGARVTVRIAALANEKFKGTVTRSAWSLDPKSRTLRTAVDLPNSDGKLRPGMYAHATVAVEHKDVLSVPAAAVVKHGEQTYAFRLENGKATRFAVRTGVRAGPWVEVLKKQGKADKPGSEGEWSSFTEDDVLLVSREGPLSDGQAVAVVAEK